MTVKLGLIKLIHKQFDVCAEAYVSSENAVVTLLTHIVVSQS